jgi:hypothetical protein
VVYSGAFIAPKIPIKGPDYESQKRIELKTRMEKQVADAKAKKHIYEGRAKKSKRWVIASAILATLGFAMFVSCQYIDAIAFYVLPIMEELTYAVYVLASATIFLGIEAIRNQLVLNEIEKDILVLNKNMELNEAKEDELNLMGLSLAGQDIIRGLNEDCKQIDVISADKLKARDLCILLENYELSQQVLTNGKYERETLGGKKYELRPKKQKASKL